MAATKQTRARSTEDFVLKAVETLRNNPKKYAAVRKSLKSAKTDRARVKSLLKFATSEKELASLLPARGGLTVSPTITTVTVTTIFILEDSAY